MGGEAGTLAAEGPLDARELDRLVQCLLLLAELAEGHDAVELLVVLAARLAAELVDFVLGRQEKHVGDPRALHRLAMQSDFRDLS